jgi:hypothetical protein
MSTYRQNYFWDADSPLSSLTGLSLLIMGSARLSWAVTITGSLIWVYGLAAFTFSFLSEIVDREFFPKSGKSYLFMVLASFWGCIYLLFFWLLCPFAALEVFLPLMLVPLFCASSGIGRKIADSPEDPQYDIYQNMTDAFFHAFVLSVLLIAFAFIREPLSFCSLSFPGSYRGMVMIFQFNDGAFVPVRLLVSSAGALILLGFLTGLYQYSKNLMFPGAKK